MSNSPKSDSEDWAEWEVLNVQNGGKSQKSPQITSVSQKIDMNKDSSNSSDESFSHIQIDANSNSTNENKNKNNPNVNVNSKPNLNNNLYSSQNNLMTSQLVTNHDDEKQSVLWADTNKLTSHCLFNNNNNNNNNPYVNMNMNMNMNPPPPRQQQYYHPNPINPNNQNNPFMNPYLNNMNMNINPNINVPSSLLHSPLPLQPQPQPQHQPQVPSSYWNSFNIFNHSQPSHTQQVQQPQVQVQTTPLLFNPLLQVSSPPQSLPILNVMPQKEKEKEQILEQDIDNKWKCVKCSTNYDESYRFCPTCGTSTSLLDGINNNNNNNNENNENILTFKQIIAAGNYDPNEKRQSGWVLNNTSKNKIKGSYKLIYIEGNEEMKVEYESYFDINLEKNEELYLLCDVTAPSISGKYSCLFQIVSNDKYEHPIGPILELNITVNKLYDEKKRK